MADENEGAKTPEEPITEPGKPAASEGSNEPEEAQVLDTHGQPGINKERHDKEVAALNETIRELQGKLDEMAKTEAGREEMGRKIAELEKKLEDEAVDHKLEMARCRNVKAARALLEDHGNDVAKLKEAEPWLFEEDKPNGSTGLPPAGTAAGDIDEKLDRAFGIKKKG